MCLVQVRVEDPRFVVDGLDRVGLGLQDQVVLFDGLLEGSLCLGRVSFTFGDREQEIAVS